MSVRTRFVSGFIHIAVCRDRWFFLGEYPKGLTMWTDDLEGTPVLYRSLTAAADRALRLVGRKGRMSGPLFWGTESTEFCPGCGMGYGAFHTSKTYAEATDELRGQTYRGAPGVMISLIPRNVIKQIARNRKLAWEAHCGGCSLEYNPNL